MAFLDKLILLKVCVWSKHTCSHTFKYALSEKHLDARVISSATVKLAFTAPSLLAVALVNKFCCSCSLLSNSWTSFCFSLTYQCSVQVSDACRHLYTKGPKGCFSPCPFCLIVKSALLCDFLNKKKNSWCAYGCKKNKKKKQQYKNPL